jgi:hypothetical protein
MGDYIVPQIYANKKDLLWIKLIAKDFEAQSSYARGPNSIRTGGSILGTWKLLAPKQISETVDHQWGEYESISTRIAEKIGEISKALNDVKGASRGVSAGYEQFKEKIKGKNVSATSLINTVAGNSAADVLKYKIDSSMVYQGTSRRTYTLIFNFANTGGPESSQNDVFEPVRELEKLSCAQVGEGFVNIKFPAIFSVRSEPSNIININHAALIAVQPTWFGPYKDGFPMSCELQLTIVDIEPLYRKSWEEGGIVRVGS